MVNGQTKSGEQISWEDDDEEEGDAEAEDSFETEGSGRFADVLIHLNGEEFELKEELEVNKNDTLNIQVRHLAPGSFVSVQMEKGGIKLSRKGFYANSLGQLDLEVRTGGKKVSGQALLTYTPSNGKKIQKKVTVRIE